MVPDVSPELYPGRVASVRELWDMGPVDGWLGLREADKNYQVRARVPFRAQGAPWLAGLPPHSCAQLPLVVVTRGLSCGLHSLSRGGRVARSQTHAHGKAAATSMGPSMVTSNSFPLGPYVFQCLQVLVPLVLAICLAT